MIGVDTNVLVRFLVDDIPEQNRAARAFFAKRTPEDPAYISSLVLAETIWLLAKRLRFPKEAVMACIRDLASSEEIVIDHAGHIRQLFQDYDNPPAELADYLLAWAAMTAGCSRTVTFDKRAAASVAGMELLT